MSKNNKNNKKINCIIIIFTLVVISYTFVVIQKNNLYDFIVEAKNCSNSNFDIIEDKTMESRTIERVVLFVFICCFLITVISSILFRRLTNNKINLLEDEFDKIP